MKRYGFMNNAVRFRGLVLLGLSLIVFSCSDKDEFMNESVLSDTVLFGFSNSNDWEKTDSVDKRNEVSRFISKIEGTDLFLHTKIENNMDIVRIPIDKDNSRAVSIDNTNLGNYDLGVFAYLTQNGQTNEFMINEHVDVSDNFKYSPVKYWPNGACTMQFYAYAPFNNNDHLSISTSNNIPKLNYTVPNDPTQHVDLLADTYSIPGDGRLKETVEFELQHLLTKVVVKTDGTLPLGKKIKKIRFKEIKNSGEIEIGAAQWTVFSSKVSTIGTMWNNPNEKPSIAGTENEVIFMMMPQTLTPDTKLSITFVDNNGVEEIVDAPIHYNDAVKDVWGMGQTVVYVISKTEVLYEFDVKINGSEEEVFEYIGGNSNLNFTSYKTTYTTGGDANGIEGNVSWKLSKIESSDTGQNDDWVEVSSTLLPEWFSSSASVPTTGNGNFSSQVDVIQALPIRKSIGDDNFAGAEKIDNSNGPYDLSTNGGTSSQSTANCYIVAKPGQYSIPLIYGNAMKDGQPNPKSYTQQEVSNHAQILHNFVDYKGNAITKPQIDGATSAELLWQDEESLVKSVKVQGDKLIFETHDDLVQGNAVLAIKDSEGKIMWSWHIWITTKSLGSNKIADMNLGWCESASQKVYPHRFIKLTFQQDESDVEKTIVLEQKEESIENPRMWGNNTCYQWGRKDPFPGNSGEVSAVKVWDFVDNHNRPVDLTKNKPVYDINNNEILFWDGQLDIDSRVIGGKVKVVLDTYRTKQNLMNIETVLQNPDVFYSPATYYLAPLSEGETYFTPTSIEGWKGYSWNLGKYLNLWNTNLIMDKDTKGNDIVKKEDIAPPIKTVYDPCPIGYRVPAYSEFYLLLGDGATVVHSDPNSHDNYPYASITLNGQTNNFHLVGGRRLTSGQMVRAQDPNNARGHYWLIEHQNIVTGAVHDFEIYGKLNEELDEETTDKERVRIQTCAYTDALSIRPVRE